MGGELTGRRLDLNFMSDRAAARDVISANLPTVIVPIQSPVLDLKNLDFPIYFSRVYPLRREISRAYGHI